MLEACLEHLNKLPDIQADAAPWMNSHGDGQLTIRSPLQSTEYVYEVKSRLTKETVGPMIAHLQQLGEEFGRKPLLLTAHLPSNVIEQLIAHKVEFVDTLGNMFIDSPAAYILICGYRPQKSEKLSKSIFTSASLKLIFVLLCSPEVLDTTYREMASSAGISLGSVSSTVQDLHQSGYLQRQRGGGYRIADYERLLNLWELGYAEKLRPKLLLATFTAGRDRTFSEISDEIVHKAVQENYLIGGELGAAIATAHLRPQRATLHVTENYRSMLVRLRLKPNPQGEITLLRRFGSTNGWEHQHPESLADPLLIRAELLIQNDHRLRETAKMLFNQYIAGRAGHSQVYSPGNQHNH